MTITAWGEFVISKHPNVLTHLSDKSDIHNGSILQKGVLMTVKTKRWKQLVILLIFISVTVGIGYFLKHDTLIIKDENLRVWSSSHNKLVFAFYLSIFLTASLFCMFIFSKSTRAIISTEGLYAPHISDEIILWDDIEWLRTINKPLGKAILFDLKKNSQSYQNVKSLKKFERVIGYKHFNKLNDNRYFNR